MICLIMTLTMFLGVSFFFYIVTSGNRERRKDRRINAILSESLCRDALVEKLPKPKETNRGKNVVTSITGDDFSASLPYKHFTRLNEVKSDEEVFSEVEQVIKKFEL